MWTLQLFWDLGAVYEPNHKQLGRFKLHELKSAGSNGCLGDWFIYQTECLHSQVRRYLGSVKPTPNGSFQVAKAQNTKIHGSMW